MNDAYFTMVYSMNYKQINMTMQYLPPPLPYPLVIWKTMPEWHDFLERNILAIFKTEKQSDEKIGDDRV